MDSDSRIATWAHKYRNNLLSKKNEAEERIDSILVNLPLNYRRESSLSVEGKQYFMDFLITSVKTPRKKIRVCLEVDGGYHKRPAQVQLDMKREIDLLSTCRVWSIVRMTVEYAMEITPEKLMNILTNPPKHGVVKYPGAEVRMI